MAEIQRIQTSRTVSTTKHGGEITTSLASKATTVIVRSIRGRDVSVIRDFVRALDAAEAPGTAQIETERTDAGHLNALTARWTEDEDTTAG